MPASNRLAASSPSLTATTAMPSPRSRSNASLSATGTRSTSTSSGAAPSGGEAARLIFDQRLAGERKQGAKPARIVLLIRPDQRAKRHIPRPDPRFAPRATVIGQARASFPPRAALNRFASLNKVGKLAVMTAYPHYAERDPDALPAIDPIERGERRSRRPAFDEMAWTEQRDEQRGAGGRQVLGWALALLGAPVARLHRLVGGPRAGRDAAWQSRRSRNGSRSPPGRWRCSASSG